MARRPRVHFPGALYHVISRGNQRQDIFLDDKDRTAYLSYLSEYKARYTVEVYAYALMRNHIHLLLEVNGLPLSRLMQTLLFRYTRYFNKRYGQVGHLFQGRYRAILCDKDVYLLELVRYIHLNPVRAKVVENPEHYLWTSHLSYLGRREAGFVDVDFVLEQFGKKRSLSRKKYQEFIWEAYNNGHQERFYEVKDQRFLGEEEFIDRIQKYKECKESVVYEIPTEVIAREVSKASGVALDRLYSPTRERPGAHGRGMVAYLARVLAGQSVKDIAEHFQRSPMRISQAIIEFENKLSGDEPLRKITDKLKKDLLKLAKKKYFVTIA